MINVLIHFTGGEDKIKTASESEDTPFAYVKLGRMNNTYSLFIKSREDFKEIRKKIKKNPNATIIGGWNRHGSKIKFPNSTDDYTRAKLRQRLKRYIRRNENGDILEDREYTDTELEAGVINKIYGWDKREL